MKLRGSVLVFSLVVLSFLLVSALSVATISVTNKRSALASKHWTLSFQTADTAAEAILYQIYKVNDAGGTTVHADLNALAGGLLGSCADGIVTMDNARVQFFTCTSCSPRSPIACNSPAWRADVTTMKIVGLYSGVIRAIEVGIAPAGCGGTVQDNDGNSYNTVAIGAQCWMAENLRTTKKPDGTDITALAYCDPVGCGLPWGRLYDWATAMNISSIYNTSLWNGVTNLGAKIQGICPNGWHIPSDFGPVDTGSSNTSDDFQKLSILLGGDGSAGLKMKQTGTTYWKSPNTGASNSSSFAGVGAGLFFPPSQYLDRMGTGNFWSSYEDSATYARYRLLTHNQTAFGSYLFNKSYGFSVRCLKD